MANKKRFSANDEMAIVNRYKGGESITSIGKSKGVSWHTIQGILDRYGVYEPIPKEEEELELVEGYNADGHLCRECVYRHKDVKKKSPGCDYYVHENKLRMDICPVEKCTLFTKGARLTKTG